jgi:hypothetical protein
MVPSPRRLPHPISRSLSRRRRLILGEEKEPEVNQRGLGRRRPFPQGDQRFESVSLQRGVCCEPDFRGRVPSMTVGDFANANPAPL